jgi:hypothetical protein
MAQVQSWTCGTAGIAAWQPSLKGSLQNHIALNEHEYRPDRQRNDLGHGLTWEAPDSSNEPQFHGFYARLHK